MAPQASFDVPESETEFPYWNRVYIAVVVATAVVIGALWLFSRKFDLR